MLPLSKSQVSKLFASAQAAMARGDLATARDGFATVAKAAPNAPEPQFHLARIARQQGDLPTALVHLAKAADAKPKEPAILNLMAECQALSGDIAAASATHDRLIALDPGNPKPLADKAHFLQQQGEFDAAETLFKKALRRAPDNGALYRMWLGGKKLAKGDPNIRKMQTLFAHPNMGDTGKIHLGFALAKAMEDSGETGKVFGYLRQANALQRKAFPNDPAARDAEVAALMAGSDDIGTQIDHDFAPLIVTGMPRSGTTLVEQILAAHDQVSAGGELGVALKLAYALFGTPPRTTRLADIPDATLQRFAAGFAAQTLARVPGNAAHVTDKSIQNHLILGHIHRALPRARLIVVRRDPRDIALSIYKNYFEGGSHRYSNDLGDIARYIKSFDRMVSFWKQRLPVHEIVYEDLIADPEGQSRALVAAAGLDWQDGCLDFHKQRGVVKTLSIAQVRKPIYKSSGGAWQRYATDMQPFITAWEAGK